METKRPASLDLLLSDEDLQDSIAKNLDRAVRVCIDIATHLATANGLAPKTTGESFRMLADKGVLDGDLAAAMNRAVGFCNVSVHDYVVEAAPHAIEGLSPSDRTLSDRPRPGNSCRR